MDDLFHIMHNPLVNSEFQICGKDAPKQLVSNIINLIAHYRYWAVKNNFDVKVFAIFTSTIRSFKNNIFIPQYREHFKRINEISHASCYFINNAIQIALPILPILSKYIPDVYIIDSKYLEPSMIPLFIAEELSTMDWNILVSRDPYDLQYAYRNKWSLLTPKGENSKVINQYGLWNYINYKEKVFKEDKDLHYPYELFIISKATVGDKYRSIPRLKKIGWKTLFNYLDKIMEENESDNIITLKTKLIEKIKGKSNLTNEEINDNLNSVNIELQKEVLLELDKTLISSQIIDIPDYNNLQEMNRVQFMKYPLNLKFLCNRANSGMSTPFD